MPLRAGDVPLLKEKLDALAHAYHDGYLATDPLGLAHAYRGARDREVAAFLSASLAFGNAAAIRMSVKRIMERLGPRPADALRSHLPEQSARLFDGLYHRWVGSEAIGVFAQAIGAALRNEGSLEALFLKGYRAGGGDASGSAHEIQGALAGLPACGSRQRKDRARRLLSPARPCERQRVQAAPPVSQVDGAAR